MKRLSVDIDKEIHDEFMGIIPWGYKCQVIRALISMCMAAVATHGITTLSDILKGKCHITYKEETNG